MWDKGVPRVSGCSLNTECWAGVCRPAPSPAPDLPVLTCRAFPKKASRTTRMASDEEIQGSKDAVIQDLERKLRFKEDLLNNGQPVWGWRWGAERDSQ